jgi:hypothetical protein
VSANPSMHEFACKCCSFAVKRPTAYNRESCFWEDSHTACCSAIYIWVRAFQLASGFKYVHLAADESRNTPHTTTNISAHNNQSNKIVHPGGYRVS